MPTRGHLAALVVAGLALIGALAITLSSDPWRHCAGEGLSRTEGTALLALLIASAVMTVGASVVVFGTRTPVRAFVVAVILYGLTAGAVAVVGLVYWGHSYTCAGG